MGAPGKKVVEVNEHIISAKPLYVKGIVAVYRQGPPSREIELKATDWGPQRTYTKQTAAIAATAAATAAATKATTTTAAQQQKQRRSSSSSSISND